MSTINRILAGLRPLALAAGLAVPADDFGNSRG